jgi:predicted HD superfamily hydrolase involved in NAD metabolism
MREQVLTWLSENVSQPRLKHILAVEKMCRELALDHDCDVEQAAQAGLMHDLAKFFAPSRLLKMALEHDIELDCLTSSHPNLLHADISALIAKRDFGIEDENILNAIRNHTLGKPNMDKLSCIVFIADKIEPNRGNTLELETMRQNSSKNLLKTVRQVCDYSIKHLLRNNSPIHPRTILTRNWSLKIERKT